MWKSKKFISLLTMAVLLVVGATTGAVMASTDDSGSSQPTVTAVAPTSGWPGETLNVVISGTDFAGATTVVFSGTGITVSDYTVDSATQITADISIANDATLGTSDVSVTTSAGKGTLSDGFTVETQHDAMLSRAAAIYEKHTRTALNLGQLQTAIDQARSEMQEQALEDRLQTLVDEGKITQDEADQYLTWWQAKPDVQIPEPMGEGMGHGCGGGHDRW